MKSRQSIRETIPKDLDSSYITEEGSGLHDAPLTGNFDHESQVFSVNAFALRDHPT